MAEAQTEKMREEGFVEIEGTGGGILKKILKEGTGECPKPGNMVSVHYTGTLFEGGAKFDSSRDRPGKFDFQVGVGQVIKGWDTGICTMKQGELCILRCRSDFAYGERGSPPSIPPAAILDFEVELFDFFEKDKEPEDMTPEELIAAGEKAKAKGTTQYKDGNFAGAQLSYSKGTTFLVELFQSADDDVKEANKPLLMALFLNSAQANLKLNEARKAIEDCTAALGYDATSVKGYFRRGQAQMKMSEFDHAKADFSKALELDPENKECASELRKCAIAAKKAAAKEKEMFGKMFA